MVYNQFWQIKGLLVLNNAILILAIVSPTQTIIDYELYDDVKHCQAVSDNINNYPPNKEGNPHVQSVCVEIDKTKITTEV